jgi:hypothetical protein
MHKRTAFIVFIISSLIIFCCAATSSAGNGKRMPSAADQLFETIAKITELRPLSKDNLEKTLGVDLKRQEIENRYWSFYAAALPHGTISSIEFSEPLKGATSRELRVILSVRPSAKITYEQVKSRYGIGNISDIIPEAMPEGLVSYSYTVDDQTITFQFTAKSYKLVTVIIVRPIY